MDKGNGILFKASFRCVLIELRRQGVTAWPLIGAGISLGGVHVQMMSWCSGRQISAPIGTYHQRQMDGAAPRIHVRLVMFRLSSGWRFSDLLLLYKDSSQRCGEFLRAEMR